MKFTSNIRNVVASGVIASAIALSFGLGGGSAYAEETSPATDQTPVSVESTTAVGDTQTATQDTSTMTTGSTTDTPTSSDTTTDTTGASSDSSSSSTEPSTDSTQTTTSDSTPSLLPGDFFYFFKTVMENIKLALTFNDTDKALQIAQYAQERIAEANALIEAGQTDLAQETLQKAIELQKQAEDTADQAGETTNAEPTANESQTSGDQPADNTDLKSEIQAQFGQNILALQTALEKVDNPKAKAALLKNIEKAQKHVGEKVAKMLEKLQKEQTPGEDQTAEGSETAQQATDTADAAVTTNAVSTQTTEMETKANQASEPAKTTATLQVKQAAEVSGEKQGQKAKTTAPSQPTAATQAQPKSIQPNAVKGSTSQQVVTEHKEQKTEVKKPEIQSEDHGKSGENKKADNHGDEKSAD